MFSTGWQLMALQLVVAVFITYNLIQLVDRSFQPLVQALNH